MRQRDPFFQRRSEWARYKHRILGSYLRVWVYKLASRSDDLAFIDTCAGEGTYGEGEPGSPLIAAKWNDEFLAPRGKRLLVLACEEKPSSARRLRENLAEYTERSPAQAVVLEGSFVETLPTVLGMTRHVPTFIFIDPYGLKDLTAEKLRPLLKQRNREPTEALVRVPPTLLARFAGWLKDRERDERGVRTAEAFRRLLSSLNIDPALLEQAQRAGQGNDVTVNEMLLSYLQLFEQRFRFVRAIPVRESYDSAVKYYLVHGTDSEHGLAHMNDIVSKAEDDLFDESVEALAGGQMSFFEAPKRQPRVSIADAEDLVVQVLGETREAAFMELRAKLVMAFGPDLREKDHKRAISNLEKAGRIARVKDHPKAQYRSYRSCSM